MILLTRFLDANRYPSGLKLQLSLENAVRPNLKII